MTSDTQTRINLTALQRRDPYIADILDSATQVAVYTFNPTSGEWEKTEIEGTLFVYSRLAPPSAGFTIMNQLNMDNLTEPLNNELEFQNQSPFLLYRNSKMLIYGIWFYDMYDCSRIGNLLVELGKKNMLSSKESLELVPLPSSPTSTSSSSAMSLFDGTLDENKTLVSTTNDDFAVKHSSTTISQQRFDIMDILSKAKKDYDKVNIKTSEENLIFQNKISKSDLFKPVPLTSENKKVDLALLFDQSDPTKTDDVIRSSSTNLLYTNKLEKDMASKHRLVASNNCPASRSYSLTNEQIQTQSPSIVNGAISVEELESPVLGAPPQRTRYLSMNDSALLTSTAISQSSVDRNVPFHKLINKASNTSLKDQQHSNKLKKQHSMTEPLHSISTQFSKDIETNVHAIPSSPFISMVKNFDSNLHTLSLSTSADHVKPGVACNFVQAEEPSNISSRMLTTLKSSNVHSTSLLSTVPVPAPTAGQNNFIPHVYGGKSSTAPSSTSKNSFRVAAVLHQSSSNEKKLLSPSTLEVNDLQLASSASPCPTRAVLESNKSSVELKTLISPDDFSSTMQSMQFHNPSSPTPSKIATPLNKKQLSDTLIALLQNDASFLQVIHDAYLHTWQKRDTHRGTDS